MRQHLEFLLGLLDEDEPPAVAAEDWEGERGVMLRSWQEAGLIAYQPGPILPPAARTARTALLTGSAVG